MKTVALIEARSGSTRLPGKIYKNVQGQISMLEMIVKRLEEANSLDAIRVSAPANDWTLLEYCKDRKIECAMGANEEIGDVMKEDYRAAGEAELIVQITGDCPLVDPVMVDHVVEKIHEDPIPDFCGYITTSGFEVRAFWKWSLKKAIDAVEGYRRDGSTIFYRPVSFQMRQIPCFCHDHMEAARARKYSVDTEEELQWIKYLYRHLPWNVSMKEVFAFVTQLGKTLSDHRGASTS